MARAWVLLVVNTMSVKASLRTSMLLICIPLLALIVSSGWMITYVQETERSLASQQLLALPFLCESSIHEAGLGRICIAAIALLILFIPFRERQTWSWSALALLLLVYFFPVFIIPHLRAFPGWHIISQGISHSGPSRVVVLDLCLPLLMLIGLLLSSPLFLQRKRLAPKDSNGGVH
jgi:hypothetical protein